MVIVKRCSVQTSFFQRSSSSSIAYGDGTDEKFISSEPISSPINRHPDSHLARSYSFNSRKQRGSWTAYSWTDSRLYQALIGATWIAAIFLTQGAWRSYNRIQYELRQQFSKHEESLNSLAEAKQGNAEIKFHIAHLLQARRVMEHEARTAAVLKTAGEDVTMLTQHDVISTWLDKRQEKMEERVVALRERISSDSRSQAIENFGPGPHRVKFTVHFIDADTIGTFVVEMASLDLMPHSVNMFLKQVQLKLWDNTVFWHHDGVDHIISAAPVQYTRGDTRYHYFDALGVRELGFAEYSPQYPHEPFTIGFAGRGPNLYINTIDNTKVHGPGGQSNNLTDDADPCFGKVVEGMETVLDMYKLQQRQSSEAEKKKSWHDDELTKIVTVEILK